MAPVRQASGKATPASADAKAKSQKDAQACSSGLTCCGGSHSLALVFATCC